MSATRSILVYGGGAVGSIFGWRIAQCSNVAVSVVCRSNFSQVNESGYAIQTNTWGSGRFRPRHVYRAGLVSQAAAHERFDYVVCANKVTDNSDSVIRDIMPLVHPGTALVSAQNGMDVELPLREAFPRNTLLSAVCNIGCNQRLPGIVEQTARLKRKAFLIGIHSPSKQGYDIDRQKRDILGAMDAEFESVGDTHQERWVKLIFNAAWNSITALMGLNTHGVLRSPDAVEIVRQLAHEAYGVALRSGVQLDADIATRTVELAKSSAPITPSTLQDARKQRPMELGPIFGMQ